MSYGLKYTIPFRTIKEVICEIRLEVKDFVGTPVELIGGADPIRISTDTSDLLTPIRPCGAAIQVFGSDYLQDLYTSDPQGIKVTLIVGGVVKWLGYLTPDTFSQDFSLPEFTYEMEAVSALSTLKYKEFDLIADFVTFQNIIDKAIEYSGYMGYYLTNSITAGADSFYSLKIPSSNFYDELGKAMTYYDVLVEIAKFAGCCFVPFEDNLYLLDYKAIREGYNNYVTTGGIVTLTSIEDVKDYQGTGAKISRIAGKNKATVNCSLYEIKDLVPEFDEEKSSVYALAPMTEYTETIKVGKEDVTYKGIIRRYVQPKFNVFHYLNGNPLSPVEATTPPLAGYSGSGFVRTAEFRADEPPSRLDMKNELQVKLGLSYSGVNTAYLKNTSPVYRVKSEKSVLTHKDVWFCLSLQFKYSPTEWTKDLAGIDFALNTETKIYQYAQLRVGKYYYNGATWGTSVRSFSMPVTMKKGSKLLNNYFSVDNTNSYDKGLGDLTGYIFKAPDFPVIGDVELTIFATPPPVKILYPIGQDYVQYMYYSDIALNYAIPDESSIWGDWVDDDSKNDVIYENEISDQFTEEADEISLKISTNPDGKLALSSVIKDNDFLTEITHPVYGTEKAENILLMRVVDMYGRPRFAVDPTLKNTYKPYTVAIEPYLNKVYMVAGGEEDVKMESCTYNLIEL